MRQLFASYWTDDAGTLEAIKRCNEKTGYVIDPHGAVAWKAWDEMRRSGMKDLVAGAKGDINKPGMTANIPSWASEVTDGKAVGIVLETAHPAKFGQTVQNAINRSPSMPDRLERVMNLEDHAIPMEKDYESFKDWLTSNL